MWTRITGLIDTWRNPMAEFKKRLLLVITGLFVLSTVVVAATKAKSKKDSAAEKDEEPVAVKVDTSGGGGKVSAEKIVRRGKRATALVEVPVKRGTRTGTGYASAFCIHETGLFLTNHHVVEKAPAEGVTLVLNPGQDDEKKLKAKVLRKDKDRDLARILHEPLRTRR